MSLITKINKRVVLYIGIYIISCFVLIGQPLRFQSYTTSQGLSQNSVYSIAQTSDKFIWFGTQDGLNRFDGMKFTKVVPQSNAGAALDYSKFFSALAVDQQDRLWTGTSEGIAIYDRYTNTFGAPEKIYSGFVSPGREYISLIMIDDKNRIWILTQDGKPIGFDLVLNKMIPLENIPKISSITQDINGNVFLSSAHEIYAFANGKLSAQEIKTKITQKKIEIIHIQGVGDKLWAIINGSEIYTFDIDDGRLDKGQSLNQKYQPEVWPGDMRLIHQSDRNTIWIGTRSNGIIKLNESKKSVLKSSESNISHSLKSQFILTLFTDGQGITWIGESVGGIAKYDNSNTFFDLYRIDRNKDGSIADNSLFCIYTSDDIDFYCGTLVGGLLQQNILTGEASRYFPDEKNTESKNIYSILPAHKNHLWLATWGGLYLFSMDTKKSSFHSVSDDAKTQELYCIIPLDENTLLTGGNQGGLRRYNIRLHTWSAPKYFSDSLDRLDFNVRYMQRLEGKIYIASEKKNFIEYDPATGELNEFPEFQHISSNARHFIKLNSTLWITTDNGLIQADWNTKSVIKLWNTSLGLANDVIYSVMNDEYDYIWISSNDGISKIYPLTGVVENYNENAGLQGKEFNTASCYKDRNGNIWMGGVNGLNKIKPVMETPVAHTSQPIITSFKVMNRELVSDTQASYLSKIRLPFNQNMIDIEFQSPDFSQTENIDYYLKMDGVDTGWVKLGKRNYMSFAQLLPGSYTLRIISNNINQRQSTEKTLQIIIEPPWFQTWWFNALSVLLIGTAGYFIYNFRINQLMKLERMRQRISADLHDDIGASLTTINVLSKMVSSHDMEKSVLNKYLGQISDQAGHVTESLRDIVWSIQPQNDKLQNLLDRMKKFAGQILESKNINYNFNISGIHSKEQVLDIETRQNVYLIFKEILNNIVKHAQATETSIILSSTPKSLQIEIRDNGIGLDDATITKGNGLNNMKQRAEKLKGKFKIGPFDSKGTIIYCEIPINIT